jgi:type II secretory pathway pseudopilin PulG
VELLIVIIVIAILATVSVVAYNGIQRRAGTIAYTNAARDTEQYIRINEVTGDFQRHPSTSEEELQAAGYLIAFILLGALGIPSPGGDCIGNIADYPATQDFEEGECYRITTTDTNGETLTEGYKINPELSTRLSESGMTLPKNLPVVRRSGTLNNLTYKISARGIYVILLEKVSYIMWNPPDSTSCGSGTNLGALLQEALNEINVDELINQVKQDPEALASMQEEYGPDWETVYRNLINELIGPNRTGACVQMFES